MRLTSRITLGIACGLSGMSRFVEKITTTLSSFAAVILTPDEIVEYGKNAYKKKSETYDIFGKEEYVKKGLIQWEKRAFEDYAKRKGSVLVLGSGGGREAIGLAKLGYKVVGIDSSEALIAASRKFARAEGVDIDFRPGDFIQVEPVGEKFDYCLLSCIMYSVVPTGKMRAEMLKRINSALNQGGTAFIHFTFIRTRDSERLLGLRRLVARISRGNTEYSIGDTFTPPFHFARTFHDENEIIREAELAGFSVRKIDFDAEETGYAVLEKRSF